MRRTAKGSATSSAAPRRRRAARAEAVAQHAPSITPLEVQLATMQALWEAAHRDGRMVDLDVARQACDIAKAAAPYVHTRFAALDQAAVAPPHEDALKDLD
jgi:hypothetical protein